MDISPVARIAIGVGLLGGAALLLTACTDDDGAANNGPSTGGSSPRGTSGSTGSTSTPNAPRTHGSDPRDGDYVPIEDVDGGKPRSEYACLRRSYEIPDYTIGTARGLASYWGGGQVELSVHDSELGWSYLTATVCGPREQAEDQLDDFNAAMRRTIADIR